MTLRPEEEVFDLRRGENYNLKGKEEECFGYEKQVPQLNQGVNPGHEVQGRE